MIPNFDFITEIIQNFKQDYGSPVDVYQVDSDSFDLSTGKRNLVRNKISVLKAFPVPETFNWQATQNRESGPAKSKHDVGTNFLCIDAQDLPENFRFSLSDLIVWNINGRVTQYEILNVQELGVAHVLSLKETKDVLPNQILTLGLSNELDVEQIIS